MRLLARSDRLRGREAPDGLHIECGCGEHFIWERRLGEAVTCPSCKAVEPIAQPKGRTVKPLIIMVGADKGGVGKTTVSRAVAEYLAKSNIQFRAIDTEIPKGVFKRFVPSAEVRDMDDIGDQMAVFDKLSPITLIDVKAGMLSHLVRTLDKARLLDEVKQDAVALVLLHVLGPTRESLGEAPTTRAAIGGGSLHFLVKNYISENEGYFGWANDPELGPVLESLASTTIAVPHLEGRAAEDVDLKNQLFGLYGMKGESRMLRGEVWAWIQRVWAEFDRIGLGKLAGEAAA